MQNQSTSSASAKDETSTVDEIKALAPLTEEWFRAKQRQYEAGKQLIGAEWGLVKKSFLSSVLFLLLFISFFTIGMIGISLVLAYALFLSGLSWIVAALIAILINFLAAIVCWKTMKRVGSHISFVHTKQAFTGNADIIKEQADE